MLKLVCFFSALFFGALSWSLNFQGNTSGDCEDQQNSEIDPELLERFKKESTAAWESARELKLKFNRPGKSIAVRFTASGTLLSNSIEKIENTGLYKVINDQHALIEEDEGNGDTVVYGLNPHYYFEIIKNKSLNQYRIVKIVKRSAAAATAAAAEEEEKEEEEEEDLTKNINYQRLARMTAADNAVESLWSFFWSNKNYQNFFEIDNLRITSLREVVYKDSKCVEVQFQFGYPIGTKKGYVLVPSIGRAIFQPDKFWALRFGIVNFNTDVFDGSPADANLPVWGTEVERDYSPALAGGVRLVRNVMSEWNPAVSEKRARCESITTVIDAQVKRGDFYLSAFGLPEPDWYKPARPWWFYTSIAGMALVVLGAGLYQLGKRWRGAATAKPGKQRRR